MEIIVGLFVVVFFVVIVWYVLVPPEECAKMMIKLGIWTQDEVDRAQRMINSMSPTERAFYQQQQEHNRRMEQAAQDKNRILENTYKAQTVFRESWDPGFQAAKNIAQQTEEMKRLHSKQMLEQNVHNSKMDYYAEDQYRQSHKDDWRNMVSDQAWLNRDKKK